MQEKNSQYDQIKVAVILRAVRSGLGLPQRALAHYLGVSQSMIARCERGNGSIPADALMKAVAFFKEEGVDIEGLFSKEPTIMFHEKLFANLYEFNQVDREHFDD